MIREDRLGGDGPVPLHRQAGHPIDAVRAIRVIADEGPARDPAHHDMTQRTRRIQAETPEAWDDRSRMDSVVSSNELIMLRASPIIKGVPYY
jgi:hypothetical protein